MGEENFEESEAWDEYQWEKFLQQQDRNTEKYFALLEKFMDHPDRDRIIAREMGWEFVEEEEWEDDSSAEVFCEEEPSEEAEEDEAFEAFASSPVYKDTLRLHTWVNAWLDKVPEQKDDPEASRLASSCAVCGAKLAAALCGSEQTELGMTIAYLKRALKSANDALASAASLVESGQMTARQRGAFQRRLYRVRDRVVDLMSEYRAEWRRRHGNG